MKTLHKNMVTQFVTAALDKHGASQALQDGMAKLLEEAYSEAEIESALQDKEGVSYDENPEAAHSAAADYHSPELVEALKLS